jgi:uncharacterized protein (UPF0210 family)
VSNAPVRTITLGVAEEHPLSAKSVQQASAILHDAYHRFTEAGYEVQTLRLSTRSIFDDLMQWSAQAIVSYVRDLQGMLDEADLSFCSLGTAHVTRPDFPLERLDLIPDMLASMLSLHTTVQLATAECGLRGDAVLPTARIMQRLARETHEGFGNFRFAMLACMPPGSPFYPAAYHEGPTSLALGIQGAGIVADALRALQAESMLEPTRITAQVRSALVAYARPLVDLGRMLAQTHSVQFGGLDPSPAPMGEDSIVTALECCGSMPFGSPGTLALSAAVTAALKTTGLPTCGYAGLMLPVLEDAVLGRYWAEGRVDVQTLLLYSAVCGTGLDTIPLSGEVTAETIALILFDVATLAVRLRKPLSARLFLVPGKRVGERTAFTSPYLTNTLLRL